MHVAERDRDQPGRDAARARCGRRRRRCASGPVDLDACGIPSSSAACDEQVGDVPVERRAARDRRARARARSCPARLGSPPGTSVAERDVDRERDVGLERERRRARAVVADLLLHGGDGDDVDLRVARLSDAPRRLERDVGAEPVVERARDEPAVRQLERLAAPDAGVAEPDERRGLLARSSAPMSMCRSACSSRGRSRDAAP